MLKIECEKLKNYRDMFFEIYLHRKTMADINYKLKSKEECSERINHAISQVDEKHSVPIDTNR